jgi:hypothetical protein
MAVVGPMQPYAGGGAVQENFRQMVDHVLTYNPDCPPQLAKRRINTRLRQLQDRRMWGGLLVRGQIVVPAAYTTGTVTATQGSALVTGVATSWPRNDLVNTTLGTAITIVNELQDVYPASMSGIEAGDWLTFDGGDTIGDPTGGTQREFMLVISVGATSFKAIPAKAHAAGETIWKSSLARRQFRIGTTTSFYGIKGVHGPAVTGQYLTLDLVWGHATFGPGSAYQIMKAYVSLEQNLRMVWSVVNNKQGWRLRLNMPQEVVNTYDTWRQTTGFCYMMVDYIPDEIGRFQYELYPAPSMEQGFPYLAYRTVPNLVDDTDTAPPAMPSHVLVNGAIADVLKYNPKSPYYDPGTARDFQMQFEADYAAAALADDSIYMQNLQWAYSRYPFTQHGANYWQSHDVDSVYGYV